MSEAKRTDGIALDPRLVKRNEASLPPGVYQPLKFDPQTNSSRNTQAPPAFPPYQHPTMGYKAALNQFLQSLPHTVKHWWIIYIIQVMTMEVELTSFRNTSF